MLVSLAMPTVTVNVCIRSLETSQKRHVVHNTMTELFPNYSGTTRTALTDLNQPS